MNRKKSKETSSLGYERRKQAVKRYSLGQMLCTGEIPWYFHGKMSTRALQNFMLCYVLVLSRILTVEQCIILAQGHYFVAWRGLISRQLEVVRNRFCMSPIYGQIKW